MSRQQLLAVNDERNLDIVIPDDLKPCEHCPWEIKNTDKIIGFIPRAFHNRSETKSI